MADANFVAGQVIGAFEFGDGEAVGFGDAAEGFAAGHDVFAGTGGWVGFARAAAAAELSKLASQLINDGLSIALPGGVHGGDAVFEGFEVSGSDGIGGGAAQFEEVGLKFFEVALGLELPDLEVFDLSGESGDFFVKNGERLSGGLVSPDSRGAGHGEQGGGRKCCQQACCHGRSVGQAGG